MKFVSHKGGPAVSAATAVLDGLAPDGGLYIPESLPRLDPSVMAAWPGAGLPTVGAAMLAPFFDDLPPAELETLLADAWDFPIRLTELEPGLSLLEQFHGPTLAFKDFGARFLARYLRRLTAADPRPVTILVATSGDTGSAVAHGFFGVPGTEVFVLYPEGRISPLQEAQMATLGGNIRACSVAGSFDDCQRLVKAALNDAALRARRRLTTANSINLGRLLPQMAYYGWAVAEWRARAGVPAAAPTLVVPSGNFGNLTAALYARTMGVPAGDCLAAVNANDVVPEFLATGAWRPRASVSTWSNAMDVGAPGNLDRIRALAGDGIDSVRRLFSAGSVTDDETLAEIRRTFERTGHLLDPHTAVGTAMARRRRAADPSAPPMIVAATAHPGKFPAVIEKALGHAPRTPPPLAAALSKPNLARRLPPEEAAFCSLLEQE